MTDITERQEAEHFRAAVMDTMVEGLYALDDQGRLTFMNSAASKLLGWSEEELRGKPMHAAIHFQHADGSPYAEDECELLKVRVQGRPVRMVHDAFTRKDGTIFPVAYSAAPLMSGTYVVESFVVFATPASSAPRRTEPGASWTRSPGWSYPGRARPGPVRPLLTADRSPRRRPAQPGAAAADARTGRRDHRAREASCQWLRSTGKSAKSIAG